MASKETLCEPCTKRGISNHATSFCTDCDKPLCPLCTDLHSSLEVLATHHLVDLEVSSKQGFNVKKSCDKHTNMSSDFFCTGHDCLCCRSCLASEHKSCDNVLPIEVAANDVRKSVLFNDISEDIRHIDETFNDLLEKKVHNKSMMSERKRAIKTEIGNLKRRILKRIDELEAKLIFDVDTIFQEQEKQDSDSMKVVSDKMQTFNSLKSQYSLLSKHGSEIQMFAFLNTGKKKIPEVVNSLHDLSNSQRCLDVKFTEEATWSSLSSLGNVTVVHAKEEVNYTPIKLKSAQTLAHAGKCIKELQFETKIICPALKNASITGIEVTRDGILVLCNGMAKHLILVTEDGKHIQNIDLPGNPWNISVDEPTNMAYVTLPDESSVAIVNLNTRKFEKQFACPGKVCGIAAKKNVLVLGGDGMVYTCKCNHEGNDIQTLAEGTGRIYSIVYLQSDKYVGCNADDGSVFIINGDILSSLPVPEMTGPVDIKIDNSGYLYIVDYKKNKIVRLNQDGSVKDVLIEGTILNQPFALAFNRDYSKLYVWNCGTMELISFSCKY